MRKPALLAATVVLAVTPALTSLTPAQADTTPAPTATATDPANTSLIELILQAFPDPVQSDARALLAGDFSKLLPLLQDMMNLTPAQLSQIFAKLQALGGLLPGGGTSSAPPTAAPAMVAQSHVTSKPRTTQDFYRLSKKLNAKQRARLRAALKTIKSGRLTPAQAVHLLLLLSH
jgi:hypothetical protein